MLGDLKITPSRPHGSVPPPNQVSFAVLVFSIALSLGFYAEADSYIGSEACAGCHQPEFKKWQGSHHDWAMKPASAATVLGDFDNASYTHQGVTSTFSTIDGEYFVNTQGADGKHQTFKIAYTFGVEPLQQYLIGFPDGRYQALTVAWDSRVQVQGGQRWYQLMPNDLGLPGESLHWTGAYYNWNAQCSECHTTGLEKNYSMAANSYDSQWAESNVGCESCHGPGSAHSTDPSKQLPVDYSQQLQWVIAEGTNIANPVGDPHEGSKTEIESCAGCHSLRSKISDNSINNAGSAAADFLDHFVPSDLRQNIYHSDGQIQDETYVYGSFMQSKMSQRGVRCSNCHDPHSQELKAEGNSVCTGCHAPAAYNTTKHHFHQALESEEAQCVSCHMPTTVYMGVDARRDHSMRVPDPRLSASLGAPNACNSCHTDETPAWAGSAISSWLKHGRLPENDDHYGKAIYAARSGQQEADQALMAVASNITNNNIARSTALRLLQDHPSQESYEAAQAGLRDGDPFVRLGALRALEFLPPEQRWQDISPLLNDKVKALRLEAVRLLLPSQNKAHRQQLKEYLPHYMAALQVNEDSPSGQLNLGQAYLAQGLYPQAELAFKHVLTLDQYNVAGFINLADCYRTQGREAEALQTLEQGIDRIAGDAALLHALGLAQIRSRQPDRALDSLKQAAQLAPEDSRYSYVYGIALNSRGQAELALEILNDSRNLHQRDRDILWALATINRDAGNIQEAKAMARELVMLFPGDNAAKQLLKTL